MFFALGAMALFSRVALAQVPAPLREDLTTCADQPLSVPDFNGGFPVIGSVNCSTHTFTLNGEAVIFDTKAQLQAASLPVGLKYASVRTVTGTYPPAAGLDACPLTYKPVNSSTGLYGEITVSGIILDPVYSTNPVNACEFGTVPDGAQSTVANSSYAPFSVTATGTTTLTTATTAGITVGMNISAINWHSRQAASLPIIPLNATVTAVPDSTHITVSAAVPAGTFYAFAWKMAVTGTDNTPMLQAAIDWALQNGHTDLQVAGGYYKTNDVLNLGYGPFNEIHLLGKSRIPTFGSFYGPTIYPAKTDRPALNYQGYRESTCRGITIVGLNYAWAAYTQNFPSAMYPTVTYPTLSADPLDWLDPTLYNAAGPGGIQPNSPYVGIAMDAYSGAAPTYPYPTRTIPSWAVSQGAAQYNNAVGSGIGLECEVDGFAVSLASGINSGVGGDQIRLKGVYAEMGVYAFSIGNSQSRNVTLTDSNTAGFHTILTNKFGVAQGELNGVFNNFTSGGFYQGFNITTGFSLPTTIAQFYCERCVRLGTFDSGGGNGAGITFNDLNFQFSVGVIPQSFISASPNMPVVLNNPNIGGPYNPRISNLMSGGGSLIINGGALYSGQGSVPGSPLKEAWGYTGGMFAGDGRFNGIGNSFSVPQPFLGSTYASGSWAPLLQGDWVQTTAGGGIITRVGMNQSTKYYRDSQGQAWTMAVPMPVGILLNTTNTYQIGAAASISNDTLTFKYCNSISGQAAVDFRSHIKTGNILYNTTTQTIFVVTGFALSGSAGTCTSPSQAYDVTAQQQNNITADTTTNAFISNQISDATLPGLTYIIGQTDVVLPTTLAYGTFNSSCAVSTASFGDGTTGGTLSTYYSAGDPYYSLLYGNPMNPNPWPSGYKGGALASVTNGSPGSMTATPGGGGSCAAGTFPIFPYPIK
jgi:hypothetical protein